MQVRVLLFQTPVAFMLTVPALGTQPEQPVSGWHPPFVNFYVMVAYRLLIGRAQAGPRHRPVLDQRRLGPRLRRYRHWGLERGARIW